MKIKKYHVSLYIIVPLIFASLTLLALVVSYRLVLYCWETRVDPLMPVSLWGVGIVGCTYLAGLVISKIILRPIEEFVENAERHPALQRPANEEKGGSEDQIKRFTQVFHQITDLLSMVDAREFFPGIIGQSEGIRSILGQILKVAPTNATVLVTGESGTGKEIIAASTHKHSKRKDGPFIAVNCAAIPEGLLESELFGHEKGSFTGAVAQRKGKFELADGGTLFLDEIGDMPLETQAKILRVLETGVCERVGGAKPVKLDVRLIAATNKDFQDMIERGLFREDLYHRLNVFPMHLPPLRERREDIPLLAKHFLRLLGHEGTLAPEAMQLLMASPWPGNVRELRNSMERAAVLAGGSPIESRHLQGLLVDKSMLGLDMPGGAIDLTERLEALERSMIEAALIKCGGVQVRAAESLGIKERSLWHRIKKYNIDVTRLK